MDKTLQSVLWSSYNHAYGTAEDIPKVIESLASSDPNVRDDALTYLESSIWHQGDLWARPLTQGM